jgi:hypothetical protein
VAFIDKLAELTTERLIRVIDNTSFESSDESKVQEYADNKLI